MPFITCDEFQRRQERQNVYIPLLGGNRQTFWHNLPQSQPVSTSELQNEKNYIKSPSPNHSN